MKKGQVFEAKVTRVDFPNKGIALTEEGPVTVKNSLPGQFIKLSVNKVRNGKAEGRLLEVMEQSPLETAKPCSHFGVCGGCNYLSLPYETQLQIKEEQVKRLLEDALKNQAVPFRWEGIKGSPISCGYRNKMEFTFGDERKDGPLALGMHKRDSFYDVVTVCDCRIVDEDYRQILEAVRSYFAEKKVSFFHRTSHLGYLRHLLVRKAYRTGEILAALVTTSQPMAGEGKGEGEQGREGEETLLRGFLDRLLSLEKEGKLSGRFAGILHIVNDSPADTIKSDRTEVLYGQDYFYEEILGLRFRISTFSFFQTNSSGAETLYQTAREYVGDLRDASGKRDKVVYDLYSGTGTIAQLLSPVAQKVIGVEIVEEAVEAARRNAAENGIENCEFLAGDVLKILDEIPEKPDLIVLDPPRDGIHPKALPKIAARAGAEKILYISCKPTSLARDLKLLQEYGYCAVRGCCVDMFPNTANVETVCLLAKTDVGQA